MQRRFDAILSDLLSGIPSLNDGPVLLAVSGGIDSMCMAELFLHSLTFKDFAVAHCNFRLRGEESDADEALVCSWAERNGIRIHKTHFDTEQFAEQSGMSIEMAARELRYGWFAELAATEGYAAVAVAHNANDNVETVILNLLRGTGIKGITGMDETGPIPSHTKTDAVLIRPLLGFTRRQIEGFVRSRGIGYRDDRTNAGTEYKRNRIRNLVFPVFSSINPSFVKTVSRETGYFSQVCGIADDYFHTKAGEFICSGRQPGEECRINVSVLVSILHWEYLLYRALDRYGFNSSVVKSVSDAISRSDTLGGKRFISGKYELLTSSSELVIRQCSANPVSANHPDVLSASDCLLVIRGEGDYFFNGVSFSVRVLHHDGNMSLRQPAGTIAFAKDRLDFPIICRRWMPGDWIRPMGMKGKKKLSDLFTDLKYGIPEKESALVLVAPPAADGPGGDVPEHHVSAVLGVRIDDSIKVPDSAGDVVKIIINQ